MLLVLIVFVNIYYTPNISLFQQIIIFKNKYKKNNIISTNCNNLVIIHNEYLLKSLTKVDWCVMTVLSTLTNTIL